ncbi:RICIN domain-containing protein [Streptomyces chrestomyceticus]|uniref:RICIN domain-containing protein n=1 Tax=Streptomyces chrestomyceticus TaxID=68185 RepID=UPI0033F55F75
MSKRTVLSGLAAALGASAVLLAGMPGSASAAEVGIQAVGHQIKNEKTGLCLDSDDQGNVYTKGCAWDKHNAYQQWDYIWDAAGDTFALRNVQTLRCLSAHSGDGINTYPCWEHNIQKWTKTFHGGAVIIRNVHYGRALDSNHDGQAYTSPYGTGNPYMRWFEQ